MGKRIDIRFVVGSEDSKSSSLWRVWSKNGQVYVESGNKGGVDKLSFHTPLICRRAFTKEFGKPDGLASRATSEWQRSPTPPAGSNRASRVLQIGFPTDYLSEKFPLNSNKPIIWVEPAPKKMVTVVDAIFTRDDSEQLRASIIGTGRELFAHWWVSDEEAFALLRSHTEWRGEDFRIPASHHENKDIVVSTADPDLTGRPVRITIYKGPKDNDCMEICEYGAYKAEPLGRVNVGSTFTRSQIHATSFNTSPRKSTF